jgi:hypothetical protein
VSTPVAPPVQVPQPPPVVTTVLSGITP